MSDTEGTRLPRAINQTLRKDIARAYGICLRCEEELEAEFKARRDARKELIHCRILGYLFHHSPTNEALETVVNEVLSCVNREDLLRLGQMYFNYLLKPFYHYIGDDTIDRDTEPPPFVPLGDVARRIINKTSRDDTTTHDKALVRDGFSCALTGVPDLRCMYKSKDLREKFPWELRDCEYTVCAHIFKEDSRSDFNQPDGVSNVCVILKRFGYENLVSELSGTGFYRLENAITLSSKTRYCFDGMCLWFAETTEPHTYEVKAGASLRHLRAMFDLPDYVTFTTPNEAKLPLPSPSYLKLHAALCEIGDLSGATDYMEQFHVRLENAFPEDSMATEVDTLSHVFRDVNMTW